MDVIYLLDEMLCEEERIIDEFVMLTMLMMMMLFE
jgi:hypothetical protein